MKFLALVIFLLSSAWAHPDLEKQMAKITSNIDTDTGRFFLLTDPEGNVDAIRYTITQRSGQVSDDQTHTWERIRDGGVTLVMREGREIIRLFVAQDFSPVTGGVVRINYLFSGVTNARRDLLIQLVRDGETFVLKRDGNLVNTLFIHGNWNVLLGLVGIANISTSYTAVVPFIYDYDPSFK